MEVVEQFLQYLKVERRYSQHTIMAYRNDMEQFCAFEPINQDQQNLVSVNSKTIRNWVVSLIENGITNRSVHRKISSLKSFYRYLQRKGLIQINPATRVVIPGVEKRLPEFVPQKSINLFLDNTKGIEENFPVFRDVLIIELFYDTGIRLSELINIQEGDVDFQNLSLKVTGKRNKQRIIPITLALSSALKKFIQVKKEYFKGTGVPYLFVNDKGAKLYPVFVYRLVRRYLSAVTTASKRSPHILRHSFATHMLNNGADINSIKEILGHANLAATQIYTHTTFEKLKEIYKQAHPRA
ncbi:MAG TPA: tyrosine-type recombinase/integrase [Bacteroidales bacterium]|nr:tyrosine-type recombinase/integrase [Bacteroidales bacterium]